MAFTCLSTVNSNLVRPNKVIQFDTGATGAASDTTAAGIRTIIYTTSASAGTGVVNVGTFTAGKTYENVTILVVSGGGGGGGNNALACGGGGGGGAVITGSTYTINQNTVCNIKVSTGGQGCTVTFVAGRNLHSSSIDISSGSILNSGTSVGSSITATNLGESGTGTSGMGAGGGGGAGHYATNGPYVRGTSSGNSLGYNGGTPYPAGTGVVSTVACGGGGGSSAVGGNGTVNSGGAGGAGIAFNTTFLGDRRYGCGGGGSVSNTNPDPVGAGGGSTFSPGGNGTKSSNGQDGAANTGMGGGGSGANSTANYRGGNGSNGVVIIRFNI
jgi:hypothetical protein